MSAEKNEVEFRREDRYAVIKYTDADKASPETRRAFSAACRKLHDSMLTRGAPARSFLVIESDWPEYELAWAMIEARVTGQPPALGGEPIKRFHVWQDRLGWHCKNDPEGNSVNYARVAPLLAEIERLNDNVRWKAVADEQRQIIEGLKAERDTHKARCEELESGLRIVAVAAKGTTLAGLKMVAKQTLNRAFGNTAKCKTCKGSGIEYDGAGHTCTACNGTGTPAAKDGTASTYVVESHMDDPKPMKDGAQ